MTGPTRNEVVAAARGMIGTPWRHQARMPGVGLDCGGLIIAVAEAVGRPVAPIDRYPRSPDGGMLRAAMDERFDAIAAPDAEPGDIVLFWLSEATRHPQHTGVLTPLHGDFGFVHALHGAGTVEVSLTPEWRSKVDTFYRYRGVASWQR